MSPPRSYMILYSFKKHISSWVVCLFWNHLLNVAIVILHLTPAASRDCPVILPGYRRGYYKEGDLIIGGVFQLFNYVAGIRRTHNIQPYQPKCFYPSFYFLRQFLAFEFAIKEINNNPKLLPNITLGYELYDSCYLEPSSVDKTLNILSGQHRYYPNYNCRKQGIVSGFVGHLLSSCSHSMANLLNIYKYPQTPHSVCSNSCLPGYRKMRREGKPICCYDCIPCKEGEITNRTDMEDCLQCSEDEWADDIKVECIKRTIYFLSIQDPVGASLTMATVGSCIITIIVMIIFIKHQDTPIVKASNWELSYILLVTLFLCFLCSFLIIGRPNYITCLLQQVTFSILFTTAVSSVLAKTITVLVAFTSTKPGRRMNIHTGKLISYSIILLCSLVEVVICTIWLVYSPPFPDRDAHSEMGKLILQCNVGSSIAFYSSLGFIGVLALFSFIVAFLARKLPDRFNEAHYITFSMLVFGSVWISFIPVYLSTKGKYLVAVEIFAILASTAALLGFIFIPKCYIIMFRPHLNIKENICASKTN